ncbi:hypothetical protein FPANT_1648 [Fusarium pseudoanthophilum]|uniref:F-box domain-containing protein n=1 Tax=Fusarium pseudoanthophilum TaxID=48495 RepID=A0A8H5PSE3_9HYPO|nr:hypothetical protein FPANT_1648 [Fusarium pseudoanthophilum]
MAGGHAKATVDIPRQVTKSMGPRDGYSYSPSSRLPTEIYQMIVNHIVLHYDRCNDDQKAIRAKTLSSLARTSRTLQCLTEPYIYTFPEDSRLQTSQGLERFQQSLAADSRRGHLVQVLYFEWDNQMSSQRLAIDIAQRCPNLHTLMLICSRRDEFSQTVVDNLAALFIVCPKVRKLRLTTFFAEDFPIPERDGLMDMFAGQLSHVELRGSGAWFKRALLPYLSPNLISFAIINPGPGDHTGFLKTLGQRCPVLQRLKIKCRGMTPVDLETLCKALGSTLKLLCLDELDHDGSVLSGLFPHMQVLEHLILGQDFPLLLHDMEAMSSLSCLRTFIAEVRGPGRLRFFRGASSDDVDRALASFLCSHRMTLETMWLDSLFSSKRDILDTLKLVPNLGSVGLWMWDKLERKDVDDLLEACPRLREAPDLEKRLNDMFGDGVDPENEFLLGIGFHDHDWWEDDRPEWDAGWSVGLRQPQRKI